MFSRREREFLTVLGGSPPHRAAALLAERFPSAGYRRRLFFGIRRKVVEVSADLQLYARAAEVEARVVRPLTPASEATVPVYHEPIAALVQRVARRLGRPPQDLSHPRRKG